MQTHLLAIVGLIFVIFGRVNANSEVQKLLEAIALGKGLYSDFPYIQPLNASNFEQKVRGTSTAWLIEFYNSWCGHCIRFMTTFKRLSADISGWHRDIQVGAVDCFQDVNVPICREFDIIMYPTMKYVPPKSSKSRGIRVKSKDAISIRREVANLLAKEKRNTFLRPFSGDILELLQKLNHNYWVVLVVECGADLNVGTQIALEYRNVVPNIEVVSTSCENRKLLYDFGRTLLRPQPFSAPAVYVVSNSGVELLDVELERNQVLRYLAKHFSKFGLDTPVPFLVDTIPDIKISLRDALDYAMKHHTLPLDKKIPTDKVYRVDIEGALKHTLTNEIAGRDEITGEKYDALRRYLRMQRKYFPFSVNGKKFLSCILTEVEKSSGAKAISGSQFYDVVMNCEKNNFPVFLERGKLWLGCRGVVLLFRGFPCGMWQMYHTLTVSSFLQNARDPLEVHKGMKGYIKHFFGCSNCVENFLQDAVTIPKEVETLRDSVLWLWRKHNKVNKRLRGDQTEDPKFPKVQFPLETSCSNCRGSDGQFDESNVLTFLRNMYSNFSNETISDYVSHKAGQRSVIYRAVIDRENDDNVVISGGKSLYGEENYCKANL